MKRKKLEIFSEEKTGDKCVQFPLRIQFFLKKATFCIALHTKENNKLLFLNSRERAAQQDSDFNILKEFTYLGKAKYFVLKLQDQIVFSVCRKLCQLEKQNKNQSPTVRWHAFYNPEILSLINILNVMVVIQIHILACIKIKADH